jgi:hypothetical protein
VEASNYLVEATKIWLTMRAGGLGGGPGQIEESKRKHFSVSTAGSPTKPLTRAVGQYGPMHIME